MLQWFNQSHPRTMQAAVILGYFSGVFALIGGGVEFLFIGLLILGGAFGTANNKKLGWIALAVGAGLLVFFRLLVIGLLFPSLNPVLMAINNTIFPGALLGATLHAHTREYMKVWFE